MPQHKKYGLRRSYVNRIFCFFVFLCRLRRLAVKRAIGSAFGGFGGTRTGCRQTLARRLRLWYNIAMEKYDRIGVIGAMDVEIEKFAAEMTDRRKENIGGSVFVSGRIFGADAVCVQSGIGKVNAAFAACTLIYRYGVKAVLMTGVAGAIGGKISSLDLIVPNGFIQHDVTMIGADDGFIDIVGKIVLRPDKRLADALAGRNCVRGIMATGEQFIDGDEQKRSILARFPDVVAADMECAAVAQVCDRLSVPFACAKVISDGGDGTEYYEFKTKAADKAVGALLGAVKTLCDKA